MLSTFSHWRTSQCCTQIGKGSGHLYRRWRQYDAACRRLWPTKWMDCFRTFLLLWSLCFSCYGVAAEFCLCSTFSLATSLLLVVPWCSERRRRRRPSSGYHIPDGNAFSFAGLYLLGPEGCYGKVQNDIATPSPGPLSGYTAIITTGTAVAVTAFTVSLNHAAFD